MFHVNVHLFSAIKMPLIPIHSYIRRTQMWHVRELNALRQMKSQMCYMENNKEQIQREKNNNNKKQKHK